MSAEALIIIGVLLIALSAQMGRTAARHHERLFGADRASAASWSRLSFAAFGFLVFLLGLSKL